ncbi:Na(+)/H(+) antiporter subunit D [Corynebacterium choanae]|uniref:Na(+)/H(+) antiporter subunit D n=1 Tax=Corynebacterium choanae TaxID=1862358 RepID=A0A3G6J8Y8_9CORY|nr:monovalent cation/H+ antiporter subunit D family protein [Corynebacterium choanae]AZA14585.1 Na(+)/H(+) antiporter subunit D [Corynebacterium choanae]
MHDHSWVVSTVAAAPGTILAAGDSAGIVPAGVSAGTWLPLFVAVPLLAAALCVLIPARRLREAIHIGVPVVVMVAALWLLQVTATEGTIATGVGRYIGGIAIPFAADAFTALMLVATALVAAVSNWFATAANETKARFYPALTLMLIAGVNGALLTADLFNLFVFIEVMLLPSYGLMAMTGSWARLAGGRTFVLVNLLTSTVLLVGVAFVYAVAGTANMAVLAGAAAGKGPLTAAMGLVIIALAVKAGTFPVHTWLPRTYPATSPAVMSLFSGLHTKVAVYAIFRIYTVIFDLDGRWAWLIVVICVISMLVGGFAGLAEHSMRRIIAYQMVNGMPFILVVLAFTQVDPTRALAAGMLYMIHHMVTVGSLVLSVGAVEETYGTGMLSKLHGLARREPLIATIVVMGSFSIVGFPPFSGTWGKLFLVMAVAKPATWLSWVVIVTIILASFGALLSMLRLWREVFWGKNLNPKRFPDQLLVPLRLALPSALLAIVSVAMFFLAGTMIAVTTTAAEGLVDVTSFSTAVLGNPGEAIGISGVDAVAGLRSDAAVDVHNEYVHQGAFTTETGVTATTTGKGH